MQTAQQLRQTMQALASPERAQQMRRFFRTGPGEYAEGDLFWGIPNPECRKVVKLFAQLPLEETARLLTDPVHELRLAALLILVRQFPRAERTEQEQMLALYETECARHINNWDLVDLSAPGIAGLYDWLYHQNTAGRFAEKDSLWEQRIAVVSTLTRIRHGEFECTLKLAKKFLDHPHDLIHKCCGWMLREVGKRDRETLTSFLEQYRLQMPRTMLRYAIEHYSDGERKHFLSR